MEYLDAVLLVFPAHIENMPDVEAEFRSIRSYGLNNLWDRFVADNVEKRPCCTRLCLIHCSLVFHACPRSYAMFLRLTVRR